MPAAIRSIVRLSIPVVLPLLMIGAVLQPAPLLHAAGLHAAGPLVACDPVTGEGCTMGPQVPGPAPAGTGPCQPISVTTSPNVLPCPGQTQPSGLPSGTGPCPPINVTTNPNVLPCLGSQPAPGGAQPCLSFFGCGQNPNAAGGSNAPGSLLITNPLAPNCTQSTSVAVAGTCPNPSQSPPPQVSPAASPCTYGAPPAGFHCVPCPDGVSTAGSISQCPQGTPCNTGIAYAPNACVSCPGGSTAASASQCPPGQQCPDGSIHYPPGDPCPAPPSPSPLPAPSASPSPGPTVSSSSPPSPSAQASPAPDSSASGQLPPNVAQAVTDNCIATIGPIACAAVDQNQLGQCVLDALGLGLMGGFNPADPAVLAAYGQCAQQQLPSLRQRAPIALRPPPERLAAIRR